MWTLNATDILKVLQEQKIEPGMGSPLLGLGSEEKAPILASEDRGTELYAALAKIARPEAVIGMLVYPPEDPEFFWFYSHRAETEFALCRETDEGLFHIDYPVSLDSLRDDLLVPLGQVTLVNEEGFHAELSRNGLTTLTAIVDILQEDALVTLLHRTRMQPVGFTAEDLLQCFRRGLAERDFRWMVQRMSQTSPAILTPTLENVTEGIEELRTLGLVKKEGTHFHPSADFALTCARLGDTRGLSALSTWKKGPDDDWDIDHMAAIQGRDTIWTYGYSQVTPAGFTVSISEMTYEIVQGLYQQMLLPLSVPVIDEKRAQIPSSATEKETVASEEPVSVEPTTPKPPPAQTEELPPPPPAIISEAKPADAKRKTCLKCGARIRPGLSFCTQCGKTIEPAEASPKEDVPPLPKTAEEPSPLSSSKSSIPSPKPEPVKTTSPALEQSDRSLVPPPPPPPPPPDESLGTDQAKEIAKPVSPDPRLPIKPEAAVTVACSRCGRKMKPGSKFCTNCGAPIKKEKKKTEKKKTVVTCPSCGAEMSAEKKFCTECGEAIKPE